MPDQNGAKFTVTIAGKVEVYLPASVWERVQYDADIDPVWDNPQELVNLMVEGLLINVSNFYGMVTNYDYFQSNGVNVSVDARVINSKQEE